MKSQPIVRMEHGERSPLCRQRTPSMHCVLSRRLRPLLGVYLALLVGTARAQANEAWPTVGGECPSRSQVVSALERLGVDARPGWRLRVVDLTPGGARLQLSNERGEQLLERRLEGRDCAALAEAVAVIVQAHFIELAARDAFPARPAASNRVQVARAARRPAASNVGLLFGLAGGATIGGTAAPAAFTGQIDLGLRLPWLALVTRVAATLDTTTAQSESPNRVERRDVRLRLELGRRWTPSGGRWWLQPAVGGGVSLAAVRAVDVVGQPGQLRPLALLSFGISGGWRLWSRTGARLEAQLSYLPWADSYRITPVGEVARSPRLAAMLALGIEVEVAGRLRGGVRR